jgi:hypothetical protein
VLTSAAGIYLIKACQGLDAQRDHDNHLDLSIKC